MWGCPCFVLDPKLQDGKKIPKWNNRSHRGQFLGFSTEHSSQVGLIRNLKTNWISPQYHVVYDEKYTTVPSTEKRWQLDVKTDNDKWTELFENGRDRYIEDEVDKNNKPLPLPELHDDWLTSEEHAEKKKQI